MAPTSVILGLASQPWTRQEGTWYDTHIGGEVIWPDKKPPDVPPCPRCNACRYLVLQAFAPHAAHSNRFILLFGCNKMECAREADTWLAWRTCQIEPTTPDDSQSRSAAGATEVVETKPQPTINWDEDTDSADSDDSALAKDLELLSLEAELAQLTKTSKRAARFDASPTCKPAKTIHKQVEEEVDESSTNASKVEAEEIEASASFKGFFVTVEEEPEKADTAEDKSVNCLLQKYLDDEKNRASTDATETWVVEPDEEDTPAKRAFETFHDTISHAPTQILRYAFAAQPLWPAHPAPSDEQFGACACGAPFAFELQLLGSCLHYLAVDAGTSSHARRAAMSFATLALYTCAADCTEAPLAHRTPTFHTFAQVVRVLRDDW